MTALPLGPIVPEVIRPLPAFEGHVGETVALEPLSTRHLDDLWEAAQAADVSWAYLKYGPFPTRQDMAADQWPRTATLFRGHPGIQRHGRGMGVIL